MEMYYTAMHERTIKTEHLLRRVGAKEKVKMGKALLPMYGCCIGTQSVLILRWNGSRRTPTTHVQQDG
jgi:hypothetical protein